MASQPYQDEDEIDRALRAFELTERRSALRMALVTQAVLLLVTVALVVTTIICALRGSAWPLLAGTGGTGTLTAAASTIATPSHRSRQRD